MSTAPGWSVPFVSATGYLFSSIDAPVPVTSRWSRVPCLAGAARPLDTLRHRFATQSYAQRRDLLAAQQPLGHSKPETTAIYAKVPDGATWSAVLGVSL